MTTCQFCGHQFTAPACPRCGAPASGSASSPTADTGATVDRSRLTPAASTPVAPPAPAPEPAPVPAAYLPPPTASEPPAMPPPPPPPPPTAVLPTSMRARGAASRPGAGRVINALCYIATGLFALVASFTGTTFEWYLPLVAVAVAAYGVWILLTRTSYWISAWVYALPALGLLVLGLRVAGKL